MPWTGRKCPKCKGTGENLNDDPVRSCAYCGGTGDEYVDDQIAEHNEDAHD